MKLDNQSIQLLNIFESLTNASVKDCFTEDSKVIFVVNTGNISKAIGPGGRKIKRVERLLKKKIKVVEFSTDPLKFIKSYLAPIKLKTIEMKDNEIQIKAEDNLYKGILIGRNRKNLNNLKQIVNKYFKVKDIKIQ